MSSDSEHAGGEGANPPEVARAPSAKQPFTERLAKVVLNFAPKSRVVLLGAGASREAGFPIGSDLDRLFRSADLPIYSTIADGLTSGVDVERVLRLMDLLSEDGPEGVASDLGRLGLRVESLRDFGDTSPKLAIALKYEIAQIRSILMSSLWKQHPPEGSGTELRPWTYLTPLINGQIGSTIATLNYDNALELAGGKAIRTAKDSAVVSAPGVSDSYARLLKLHGSIDWKQVDEEVTRSAGPFAGVTYQPAIIFGSGNKLRHYGPFLELLREFQLSLARAERLVVIGYGWRDPHINAEIKRWARARDRAKHLSVNVMPGDEQPRLVSHIESEYRHVNVKVHPRPASEMIRRLF